MTKSIGAIGFVFVFVVPIALYLMLAGASILLDVADTLTRIRQRRSA